MCLAPEITVERRAIQPAERHYVELNLAYLLDGAGPH